jgi:hypothetical protein
VGLVRTDVSEECIASIIRMTRIGELGMLAAREAIRSSETSVLTRPTLLNIPDDGILHSHRRENLIFYIELTGWALQRISNVSPVRYELRFYIPGDGILHNHRQEDLKTFKKIAVF